MDEVAKTSDADYHHGAEELARIFESRLMRHLVDVRFTGERKMLLCVGKFEVELLIDPSMSSDCIKLVNGEGRILAQVANVRVAP